ncbi:replication factor A protein 3 [Testicularia cyperi]|uniref:Replication factor A protein 3 n=1 Tax=Testicularia cyperi TaxID=1882483 RepID=A0A317XV15_9BASI|nr:replication factor A protein 3 [Testicularia cyperi]
MEKPIPMVNSSMLPQFRGQTVRVVGKVHKLTGQTLLLQTSDLGTVEVALNPDSEISGSQFVEVTGKVSDSSDSDQIREFTTVNIGDDVDMTLVENVVQISTAFPALFTEA